MKKSYRMLLLYQSSSSCPIVFLLRHCITLTPWHLEHLTNKALHFHFKAILVEVLLPSATNVQRHTNLLRFRTSSNWQFYQYLFTCIRYRIIYFCFLVFVFFFRHQLASNIWTTKIFFICVCFLLFLCVRLLCIFFLLTLNLSLIALNLFYCMEVELKLNRNNFKKDLRAPFRKS